MTHCRNCSLKLHPHDARTIKLDGIPLFCNQACYSWHQRYVENYKLLHRLPSLASIGGSGY